MGNVNKVVYPRQQMPLTGMQTPEVQRTLPKLFQGVLLTRLPLMARIVHVINLQSAGRPSLFC